MKKVIAILVGIEIGAFLSAVTFITLFGYILTGILASVAAQILPIEDQQLQMLFGYATVGIIMTASILTCLMLASALENFFKWAVLIIPMAIGIVYLSIYRPVDKQSAIQKELRMHQVLDRKTPLLYELKLKSLESKLNKIADTESAAENFYFRLFATDKVMTGSITIDSMFITERQIGLCVYTLKKQDSYAAISVYFNPDNDRIYTGGANLRKYGKTRSEALLELYYELYIERKERTKAIYSPDYETWIETVPNILDSEYWTTTIKEDTLRLKVYGEL